MVNLEVVLVELFVLILLASIASVICKRLEVPVVVGVVLVGIAISNITIDGQSLYSLLQLDQEENEAIFKVFAELGVIFLLFIVGLETPLHELRKVGKVAAMVAVLGVVIPFVAGLAFMLLLQFETLESLFIASALVATSVGITAYVLKDMGMIETIEAKTILAAAVIDDVIGLVILSMVSGIAEGSGTSLLDIAAVAILAVAFVLLVMFATYLIPKSRSKIKEIKPTGRWHKHLSPLPFALIVCFGISALASYLNLAAIIGAFLAGMLFAEFKDTWPAEEKLEPINEFLVPFFFLQIGFMVSLSSMTGEGVLLIAISLTLIAIATKWAGSWLGARSMGKGSANVVAMGMIPRGEVGIIIASIGLTAGVLTDSLYATVIFMVLATTLIAPYMIRWAIKRRGNWKGAFKGAPSKFREI
ncbi:MAG: cation:proton antiporter [Methanomassiliicoccales archaeon]|nr:cation:proton antiporter [Methanomassiliicoccales archaeon]MDD1757067.1 cation:proton antiporter [Methanomassiliicoccales archaeon]